MLLIYLYLLHRENKEKGKKSSAENIWFQQNFEPFNTHEATNSKVLSSTHLSSPHHHHHHHPPSPSSLPHIYTASQLFRVASLQEWSGRGSAVANSWLLTMSVPVCLTLLALFSLTAASNPECDELRKPLTNQTQVRCPQHSHWGWSSFWRATLVVVVVVVFSLNMDFQQLICISPSRLLENGFSMLEHQTMKFSWRNLKSSTAHGLWSIPYLIVKIWAFTLEIKCNCWLFIVYTLKQQSAWALCDLCVCYLYLSLQGVKNVFMEALISPSQKTPPKWHVSHFYMYYYVFQLVITRSVFCL